MFSFKRKIKYIVEKLPFSWKQRIYFLWNRLHRDISLNNRSIRTDSGCLTEEEKQIKIVGFLKVHNELSSGNLKRVLNHMKEICDEIVVCDCESRDGSFEFISLYTQHILREKNHFDDEIRVKQKMLEYASSLNPDWILWLDADEVIERKGEQGAVRKLCAYANREGIDGFSFNTLNLWGTTKQYRVDGLWHNAQYVRLWKNNGKLFFPNQKGLHQQQHPLGMENIQKSDLSVIHYGFSSPEIIQEKYERYKSHGQSGFALERIAPHAPGLKLRDIDIDMIPYSALRVSVVVLIYRSVEYIKFVYRSFLKHQEGAEILFIANDATDRVKNYLKEQNLPHLVFENEDKDEYYLKRVYRAWNFGGMEAPGDIILFVNSDMAFSSGWVKNLLKNLNKKRIVCSRLVESGKMPSGQYGISKDFGQTYSAYDENGFESYARKVSEPKLKQGGLFMPCMVYKDIFVKSGGYPIGNRKVEGSEKEISGDYIWVYERLKELGVEHYTAFDSMVYHIQEGEMDD